MTIAPAADQLDAENPWPGLDAFEESAHGFFHGRDGEAATLLRSVLDSPITVLYGRSGLGKTSLLQAALFPALRENHFLPIYVRLDFAADSLPIADQLRETARRALQSEIPDARLPGDHESIWEYLHSADLELWSTRNFLLTPVLIIDQFEEVFTLGPRVPGLVERFRDDFGDLVENRIPADLAARIEDDEATSAGLALRSRHYKVLISLREDFLPDLETWRHLVPMLGRPRLRLLPMSTEAALEAVHEPAAHILTRAQAERIVRFIAGENAGGSPAGSDNGFAPGGPLTGRDVEPALLSLFCRELNEARKRQGQQRFDEQLIEGAQRDVLANYYASCIDGLPAHVAHFVETQLITQKGFRNFYARDDAVPAQLTEDELGRLIHSRLVRLEERYGTQRIELSHDVLTGIVRERRDNKEVQAERAALTAKLESERKAAAERERELEHERFVEQQLRLRAAEQERRRLRWLSAALAVLLLAASILGVASFSFYRDAQRQRSLAVSRLKVGQAAQIVDQQPQLAILLGLEGLSAGRDSTSVPPPPLVTALARVNHASRLLTGHTAAVLGVRFSPDGRLVASASGDQTVRLWDTATGAAHGPPLTGHTDIVTAVTFSPDGRLLATTSADRTVRLWDTATGRPHGPPLTGHTGTVFGVAFSPDGHLLATAGDDATVRLWDPATGQPRGVLAGHTDAVYGVAFSPDGHLLATASGDRTVRLWDAGTHEPRMTLNGHTDAVRGLSFSPDGRLLATASTDQTVRLWDPATGQPRGVLAGHTGPVYAVTFSPDGRLLATASADRTVRFWDTATGNAHDAPLSGHTDTVTAVAFSPDGRTLASASDDQSVRVWSVEETYSVSTPLAGHTAATYDVAFSPDGRLLASAGGDKTVRLWDTTTGQPHGPPLAGHIGSVYSVAFSPDGRLLATAGADGTVRLWDTATGTAHGSPLIGHIGSVYSVAFSPDGRLLATADDDGIARLWDTATGAAHGPPLIGHTGLVSSAAFSPDGRLLATASADGTARLWDTATGAAHGPPLIGHTGPVYSVAFSPDGRLLATASADRTARLWDIATGSPHGAPLTGQTDTVTSVAFSPDGRLLATASADRSARLWDIATGSTHGPVLTGHTDTVNAVAFSPDGTLLATASTDGTARLWHLGFSRWVEAGCNLVGRNLSLREWSQFSPGEPYERTCPGLPSGDGAPPDAPAAQYAPGQ